MDIDSIFKTPTAPASKGGTKRKLVSPDEIYLKTARHTSYEELTGRKFEVGNGGEGSSSKRRTVSIEDEQDEESSVGIANPEEDDEDDRFFGDGLTNDQKDILDYVDDLDPNEERFDLHSVRKMILKFEKAINKNQDMRVKYPDEPTKFMESEMDLDEEIKHLMAMTQAPRYYPVMIELNTISSILSLLSHENPDISIDAIELLKELTDEEVLDLEEDEEDNTNEQDVIRSSNTEGMKVFVEALVKEGLLELLVQTLQRLDESEVNDRQGIFNTLAVYENLTSIDMQLAKTIVEKSELLPWLMKRLKVKAFDSNKQYCSEILAILMQTIPENRKRFGEMGGIDDLLQFLAAYRRKDPKDPDEIEMMENLFNALCSVLQEKANKRLFLEGEGIELMVIMIKEKKMARIRAVKVLDYAMSTKAGTANCLRFVEIKGLKTLFSVFSRKGVEKLKKQYKFFSEVEEEEHIIGILGSLVRNLPLESGHRLRVVRKFTEEDYAKLERLLDLREGYEARVSLFDERVAEENKELDEEEIEEREALRALERLDAGLYVMQLIDLIIAHLCAENLDIGDQVDEDRDDDEEGGKKASMTKPAAPAEKLASFEDKESEIKTKVRVLLNRRGQSLDDIKSNLQAYLDGLEVDTPLAEAARTKLLSQIGTEVLHGGTVVIDVSTSRSAASSAKEEGEIDTEDKKQDSVDNNGMDLDLSREEEDALEALEAREFTEYMLGLL
ncbi:hypothetical protein BGW38_010513 [Lunasporangiospora selenospora]|uniref:Beta-catenin-like protein 1 N-terminal domain-containing protein n=1 Tax=Lunasporangiospora selenospora TaxID=979761 RepID=A0A9P6FYF4_9FUNG|nr:hypothetical protein BGW38_010513 [Lunasporangiospora selenospora]